MLGICGRLELPLLLAPYPQLYPDPSDPADPYLHTLVFKLMLQPLRTKSLTGPLMGRFDLHFQPPLFLGMFGRLPMEPFVIATLGYPQNTAHHPDTIPESHCFHDRVPGSDSFAKYAVAFFSMSRSILASASSRLTRASSISTSVSGLCCLPTSLSLPSLFALTQYRMVEGATDNLRPTSGMLSPPSATSLTASSRSSFVSIAFGILSMLTAPS